MLGRARSTLCPGEEDVSWHSLPISRTPPRQDSTHLWLSMAVPGAPAGIPGTRTPLTREYLGPWSITQIYEGTNQIQRVVIAKSLLG